MAGELFGFYGKISGAEYRRVSFENLDDIETAYKLNEVYDEIKEKDHWARREHLVIEVILNNFEKLELDL